MLDLTASSPAIRHSAPHPARGTGKHEYARSRCSSTASAPNASGRGQFERRHDRRSGFHTAPRSSPASATTQSAFHFRTAQSRRPSAPRPVRGRPNDYDPARTLPPCRCHAAAATGGTCDRGGPERLPSPGHKSGDRRYGILRRQRVRLPGRRLKRCEPGTSWVALGTGTSDQSWSRADGPSS